MTEDFKSTRGQRLNEFRFAPTDYSLQKMQELKRALPDLRSEIPEVRGFAFYGSRVHGRERPENGADRSDVDVCVFYDSSDIADSRKKVAVVERIVELEGRIRRAVHKRLEAIDLPAHGYEPQVALFDINREQINFFIQQFIQEVKKNIETNGDNLPFQIWAKRLFPIFLLSTSRAVYEARDSFFTALEKEPQGDVYWDLFIGLFEKFERHKVVDKDGKTVIFKHWPRTTKEAREYFFVK
ncbi:MAG: nucleotidyltransferase domain-containing protein [Candidatus Magasanikbacteria bacterium]|nr:nucleotidyltransferase domain-containing protein [Candidatus Magasanikbacteria bacterium]